MSRQMMPGEYIPQELIVSAEHLEAIRNTVGGAQHWSPWGKCKVSAALVLHSDGQLCWTDKTGTQYEDRTPITPEELGVGVHDWKITGINEGIARYRCTKCDGLVDGKHPKFTCPGKPKEEDMSDEKCKATGCNNKATHEWSGHPTCDEHAMPASVRYQDDGILQGPALHEKIAEVMRRREDWWVEFEYRRCGDGTQIQAKSEMQLLNAKLSGYLIRHRPPKVKLEGEVDPDVIRVANNCCENRGWLTNEYLLAKALLACVADDQ